MFGKGTWYGSVGKVLQVSDGDAVVRDEVEAMDVGGDLFGGSDDCVRLLDLYSEAMMMKMTLKPVIAMIMINQETKVAHFHDSVS